MAADNQPLTLLNMPLEVRHHIFMYVALRDTPPGNLLRYWFEKQELKEKTAELIALHPNVSQRRIIFEGDQVEHEDLEEEDGGEDGGEDGEDDEEDNDGDEESSDNDDEEPHDIGNILDVEDGDDDEADDIAGENMVEADGDANASAGATQPSSSAPVITIHRKWRHIPKFMRMTHCPPPVELLLTSKQLNYEAKNWYYDVDVLCIEATGSFAHTSFFEEAFSQITEAAFSPVEEIRKTEVTFVWDTTWLRSDQAEHAGAIFPALLRQRALFIVNVLTQAPNLSEVTIHWHDSAQDEDALDLMNEVVMGFLSLGADIKLKTHYIAVDARPLKESIAGRRRLEFQNIVSDGLDRLF